jgi:hypothetical protein
LPNTARQALLYRALSEREPEFVHLGLILGPDGKKLSKRHGAASIAEYRSEGYLSEALVSYLALLGWSHRRAGRSSRTSTGSRGSGTPRASARALLPSTLIASSSSTPAASGHCRPRSFTSDWRPFWTNPCRREESFSRWRRCGTRCGCSRTRRGWCVRSQARRTFRLCPRAAGIERGGLRVRCRSSGRPGDRGSGERERARPRASCLGEGGRYKDARAAAPFEARAYGSGSGAGDGVPLRGVGRRRGAGADRTRERG